MRCGIVIAVICLSRLPATVVADVGLLHAQAEAEDVIRDDSQPWLPQQPEPPMPEPLTTAPFRQETLPSIPSQLGMPPPGDRRFDSTFLGDTQRFNIGLDLYSAPEFDGGLVIYGDQVAMKVSGFVKADFIYDFDPIDSQDSFVTTTIPVDAPPRTNSRAHARQTRLSLDTRWPTQERLVKIFVEGDFFGASEQFRLRHAFGEVENLLVGKTWTTFTYVGAAPATLDFEGSVSSVNRRQAQARWTRPIRDIEHLTLALAIEDTQFRIETVPGVTGEPRSPSPDFVSHVRYEGEFFRGQIAGLYRVGGFQAIGQPVQTGTGWGINSAGVIQFQPCTKAYSQIVFGEGIGSYRGLPDAVPTVRDRAEPLGMFSWMIGITHNWNAALSSNFTYAKNTLDTTEFASNDTLRETTYLAANLIWRPLDRVSIGAEYLYGTRINVDGRSGEANRVQVAFIFDLP